MPAKKTIKNAKKDLRRGKRPSTAAGEFVHEEVEHIRQGKHGARSTKQAIAIGLSKARRAGVPLAPPKKGRAPEQTRRSAKRALEAGQLHGAAKKPVSQRRSKAVSHALEREGEGAASSDALARQARRAAAQRRKRGPATASRAGTAAPSRATRTPRRRSPQRKSAPSPRRSH